MDLGLTGKVALGTGGSRTIGYSIARRLGMEGAKVAICARGERNLLGAVEKLRAEGVDAWGRGADVSDRQQVRRLVSEVVERFGRLGGAFYLARRGRVPHRSHGALRRRGGWCSITSSPTRFAGRVGLRWSGREG